MNTKISDVFYIRRRNAIAPQTFDVEYGGETKTVRTMADSVRPLLTSMKLFGLYFRSRTETGDKVTDKKSRRRWNQYMIYALIVAVLLWIYVVRMFSVFKNITVLSLVFRLCYLPDVKCSRNVSNP